MPVPGNQGANTTSALAVQRIRISNARVLHKKLDSSLFSNVVKQNYKMNLHPKLTLDFAQNAKAAANQRCDSFNRWRSPITVRPYKNRI
jgi:hypothetical protein